MSPSKEAHPLSNRTNPLDKLKMFLTELRFSKRVERIIERTRVYHEKPDIWKEEINIAMNIYKRLNEDLVGEKPLKVGEEYEMYLQAMKNPLSRNLDFSARATFGNKDSKDYLKEYYQDVIIATIFSRLTDNDEGKISNDIREILHYINLKNKPRLRLGLDLNAVFAIKTLRILQNKRVFLNESQIEVLESIVNAIDDAEVKSYIRNRFREGVKQPPTAERKPMPEPNPRKGLGQIISFSVEITNQSEHPATDGNILKHLSKEMKGQDFAISDISNDIPKEDKDLIRIIYQRAKKYRKLTDGVSWTDSNKDLSALLIAFRSTAASIRFGSERERLMSSMKLVFDKRLTEPNFIPFNSELLKILWDKFDRQHNSDDLNDFLKVKGVAEIFLVLRDVFFLQLLREEIKKSKEFMQKGDLKIYGPPSISVKELQSFGKREEFDLTSFEQLDFRKLIDLGVFFALNRQILEKIRAAKSDTEDSVSYGNTIIPYRVKVSTTKRGVRLCRAIPRYNEEEGRDIATWTNY